jgi:hypothetical protein
MGEQERRWAVERLLRDVGKASRIEWMREQLVKQIMDVFRDEAWEKWTRARTDLVEQSCALWIPIADLAEVLNRMPGPHLTLTDVNERRLAMDDVGSDEDWSRERLQAAYAEERTQGTEMRAILGRLSRLYGEILAAHWQEERAAQQRQKEAQHQAAEARVLSGADFQWRNTQGGRYCRRGGVLFRLERVESILRLYANAKLGERGGELVGSYKDQSAANRAVLQVSGLAKR